MADSILVVGGTGMLGKPVVKRLTLDGHPVRVVTRQPDRARIALGKDVEVQSTGGRSVRACWPAARHR
ncbi:MAG: NmrA family NAD(P)-binding protein, partial [Myxococcales bacterium]